MEDLCPKVRRGWKFLRDSAMCQGGIFKPSVNRLKMNRKIYNYGHIKERVKEMSA